MLEIFQYQFMQNAFLAAILASIACGIIGSFVVVKRIVFITGGIAHAAFGGIGIGYFLGINPVIAVTPFSLLTAILLGFISKNAQVSEDSAIGMLWSFGMAIGILFIGLSSKYAPDLFSYLFGNILAVPRQDLLIMIFLNITILLTVYIFYKPLLLFIFDEEYAKTRGINSQFIYILLLCLIALTIVILIRIVGIILVIALLTTPASIAKLLTSNFKKMMLISTIFGMFLTLSGLLLSYFFNLPSGATIILFSISTYFLISLTVKIKNYLSN